MAKKWHTVVCKCGGEEHSVFASSKKEAEETADSMCTADQLRCMYCGEPTDSNDKNVLCSDCREAFGHTFYSEL